MTFISARARRIAISDIGLPDRTSYRLEATYADDAAIEVRDLDYLHNRYEADGRIFWSMMQLRHGNARVTPPLLRDVLATQDLVTRFRADQVKRGRDPFSILFSAPKSPGSTASAATWHCSATASVCRTETP